MKNRLAQESSLYLKQHADNPVDWYPWGPEALATAQAENKPLLVSIGYSACHWCHVMAHECFEDPYIAKLMNQHFICVKVDREERPDVDAVYMEAVQMIQQQGGWPLNVFCLPDGRPFFGGTYFPPEDRGGGRIPWPQVLMRVADFYKRSKSDLVENADAIQKNILASVSETHAPVEDWDASVLVSAAQGICGNHDDQYGGFGSAPKFPPAMALNFLAALRHSSLLEEVDSDFRERLDSVRHTTLRAMAHGGLFDQFGGGFARYSVDAHWLIPHFEKMLYDNALLLDAYTRGWLENASPLYAAVVAETVEWLFREMAAPCGGFYAALDADSEGVEGRYYVWSPDEVDAVLELATARRVRITYNITAAGNFEHGFSNPALVDDDFTVRESLAGARAQLRAHREAERVSPGRDTKLSTAWNGMMIRALADAGFYFDRPEWLRRAQQASDFLWDELVYRDEAGGLCRVRSVYYEDHGAKIDGFLQDYVLAAEAFLAVASKIDWLEPGLSKIYEKRAQICVDSALIYFLDPKGSGFFITGEGVETPVARRKDWFDNATPSGNSVLLHALSALAALTGEPRYEVAFQSLLPAYKTYALRVAAGVAHALEAATSDANAVQVIKMSPDANRNGLQALLSRVPWRRTFLRSEEHPFNGGNHFLVCQGKQCWAPLKTLSDLELLLRK